MKEFYQAGRFYRSLSPEEREDLAEAVAENIFFLDEELQEKVVLLLEKADRELGNKIKEKNRR